MIEQFFIVNKSGGMVYRYEATAETDVNTLLILTSTLHSLNELSRNVLGTTAFSQVVEMAKRSIYVYRALTGMVFIFVYKYGAQESGKHIDLRCVFENVYRHFCDFVLSNPFYPDNMPINCSKFKPEQFFTLKS